MAKTRTKPDDAKPRAVPWTEELACKAVRVDPQATRQTKLLEFQKALEDGDERLPDGAVQALVKAGYTELA